jgi:hypothetical protein
MALVAQMVVHAGWQPVSKAGWPDEFVKNIAQKVAQYNLFKINAQP